MDINTKNLQQISMNTKIVINIKNLQPDGTYDFLGVDEVPRDYLECSVSGEYRPRHEFTNDGKNVLRTNCVRTYKMKSADMEKVKQHLAEIRDSDRYYEIQSECREHNQDLEIKEDAITVKTLIDYLSSLNPDDMVLAISGEDGSFVPLYKPSLLRTMKDGTKVYTI